MEESIESCRIAEEAGADYVSVTIGWHESSQSVITRDVPMGHWLYVAEAVKKALKIPVMMAFRQFLPHVPESAIASHQIDFWEMCRPMIADPELPRKVREGCEDEIVPCIACNLCFSRLYYHQPIMCSVRPTLGYEGEKNWGYYGFSESRKRKKIIIAGGGPAGLMCAVTAAQRGHEVTLFEKEYHLGGNILLASKVDDGAIELLRPIKTLKVLCDKAGVVFRLGVECTLEVLKETNADAVVIATGPTIKNLSRGMLTPQDIIGEEKKPGQHVVIVGGGGVGLAVAVFLLHHDDYRITIVEQSGKIGKDVNPFYLWQYLGLMKKKKVVFHNQIKACSIEDNLVHISTLLGEQTIETDSVVMALFEPEKTWRESFQGMEREIYFIGDAKKPRRLNNAIHDGYRLGMVI
jgi:2,4-dienoyl-CoA reductase (NADPH2)